VIISRTATAPIIDGNLDDPIWHTSSVMSNFASLNGKSEVLQPTDAKLLWDSKYLYIGIHCTEPDMAALVSSIKEHDGPVWRDDSIEILIDTLDTKRSCYHLIINSIGVLADEANLGEDHTNTSWESKCRIKTSREPGGWVIEAALPFSSLGISPSPGLVWGLNICRSRLPGPSEYSSWSPTSGGFVQPQYFGSTVLGDKTGKWDGIRLLSWGNPASDISTGKMNAVKCSIPNNESEDRIYNINLDGIVSGKSAFSVHRKANILAGQTTSVDLPYVLSSATKVTFSVSISSGKSSIYKAQQVITPVAHVSRVWDVKDPLFKTLLSKTPPGDQKNGSIYWFHSGIASQLIPFAKENGLRYSLEEQYKELAECRLMPVSQRGDMENANRIPMANKYGVKSLYTADYRGSRADGVPQIEGLPFMLDPRSKAAFMRDLKTALELYRKYIWGIYTQDEMHECAARQGVLFFNQMKDTYPYILQVDQDVKKQFGFGKYGIPTSLTDSNPYRWIAYHKWINKQILDWQKETFEMTRRIAPEIRVISVDPVAGHNPLQLDEFAPYIDIATHQLYPSSNPNRQEFGFVTKFVVDLMGKPVWPCAHVENYGYSTTPEETRELMSQIIRSGAKGFHLYLPDVRGSEADRGDTFLTKYGCPERYRAIKEILNTTYNMNEVSMPEDPDCAIFYSEDNYQSYPASEYVYPVEPEFAYTFLGPVARTWFKFINDNMILNGKAKLSTYKAVIIPAAKYQRLSVVSALTDYVKGGGTLICGDPEAFSWTSNAASLSEQHKQLFGASVSPAGKRSSILFSQACSLKRLRGVKLSVMSATYNLSITPGTEILARFNDGHPAVIRHRVGRGSVILFAFQPFVNNAIADAGWKKAFKSLCLDLGLKVNRNIWRFKFPEFKTVYKADIKDVCLTGNYIKWSQEQPLDVNNSIDAGTYSYSVAPDSIVDRGESNSISFTTGKLTDRKRAPMIPKSELHPEDFIVTWKTPRPVGITFDFKSLCKINRIHLWYSDQLPALTVEGSIDGITWNKLADYPKQPSTKDVFDVSLALKPGSQIRYVRLSLGERDTDQAMTLVEAEVWSSVK